MIGYQNILEARDTIKETLVPTPMLRAMEFERHIDGVIHLKGELFQKTGSFKSRGALNWVRRAPSDHLKQGLITVSAGNHASALAWAAQDVGVSLTVVMPEDASPLKIEATRSYGAEVILHGAIHDALEKTTELQQERNLILVHPYDDPLVIAGQGTVGLEIAEQVPDVDVVVCPVGGGGLISGIGLALRHLRPDCEIIGVEPERAATLRVAWDRGGPEALPSIDTIAPSLGAGIAGQHTYAISREVVSDIITLSEDEIRQGMLDVFQLGKLYAEPGGAIAAAALASGRVALKPSQTAVAIVTGGNLDVQHLSRLL